MADQRQILDPGDIEFSENKNFKDIPSECFGSFIHGSEDEFLNVRIAAIESISHIGMISKFFSVKAIPFLIDMFNDEEGLARMLAVQNVAKLNSKWNFSIPDSNIDSFLLALRDNDVLVKSFAHRMYQGLKFQTLQGFRRVIEVLLDEVKIYQNYNALETLSILGKSHPEFIGLTPWQFLTILDLLLPSFFDVQSTYLSQEYSLSDHQCKPFQSCKSNLE